MNMVAPQGGGDSHLMGSPIQAGGLDTAGLLGMVQGKMDGGRRRKLRQRGGVTDGALASATDSIVKALQNGGRRRSYKKKSSKRKSKRSGKTKRGGKRSSKRKTYRKKRMTGGVIVL